MQPVKSPERDVTGTTLEAFADTIVPGERRTAHDRAVAGAAAGPGAVQAGALELLNTPATGVSADLDELAAMLNRHARSHATREAVALDAEVPPFVSLPFADRTALVRLLLSPGHPEQEAWVLLALFTNMAFDTAAHMHTAEAFAAGHPGLAAMGIAEPDDDGLWRFPRYSYGRRLAQTHPDTTPSGSPA